MSDGDSKNPWVIQRCEAIPSFCIDSWLSSFRSSPWAGPVVNNAYRAVYTETIRQLVARGAQVLVAVNPDYPDHILGWICTERTRDGKPVVHMVYVKSLFRRKRVASSLFEAAGINPKERFYYTFRTQQAGRFPGGKYCREIACRKEP